MCTLSKTMPLNSITWEGPMVLDATTGTLSDMKTGSRVLKLERQDNFDCSAIKRSSRILLTCWRP